MPSCGEFQNDSPVRSLLGIRPIYGTGGDYKNIHKWQDRKQNWAKNIRRSNEPKILLILIFLVVKIVLGISHFNIFTPFLALRTKSSFSWVS